MNSTDKWYLTELPLKKDVESKIILKKLPAAHAALAELKGISSSIPNQSILINTLSLQEAKDSSAIENIITTHDDLYKTELLLANNQSLNAKEVQRYIYALKRGFELLRKNKIITNRSILEVQEILEENKAGYRKLPGTELKNSTTGQVVYTPPQHADEINRLMSNLIQFINNPDLSDYDPLVKMAIIHFQFESIHPFYDGNGRTGRIINILYLILEELLELPILYLSSYIIRNKKDYYRLLQKIREENEWEDWILFMVEGIRETSKETIHLIIKIKELMLKSKHELRDNYKFYSQELLNNMFQHPYTKIDFLVRDLKVSRITAANYLNKLADDGILKKEKLGTGNYYINERLYALLTGR